MTVRWNATKAMRHLDSDPTAGTAEVYGEMLAKCPVARVEVAGSKVDWWAALGHAELTSVLRNFRGMSSTVTTDADGMPAIIPLFADPPLHTGFRKLLNPNFPPEVVGRLESGIRQVAVEMVDAMVAAGEVDFAEAFSFPYPTRVLCRFLGVPDSDWPVHHDFVMTIDELSNSGLSDPETKMFDKPFGDIAPYVLKVVADHRENPRDDIVDSFIAGQVEGRSLSDYEIVKLMIAMMLAGHATTTAALANTVLRLAQDQEVQDRLRAEPHRIPDAIEESLRIDTPQQTLSRKCLVDTELGGEKIAAGEYVLVNYGSANVDPARFPDPGRFDLDRADKNHLAFGFGLHACLGQHLARLDLRIALEELLARTSSFSINGDVVRRSYPVLSVNEMPLRMNAAGSSDAE
ncbi:cytochrome P450 [Streptomyces canus]|uniref:cytochrome P450 n=1 Tax=Streptomyces canus TaxID=58343 RepID=UPI002E2C5DA4|nr:cytochrome P450 [Streptomyces canus]